jgi:hypothetical protein
LKAPRAHSAGISKPKAPKTLRYLSSSFQYLKIPKRAKKQKKNRKYGLLVENALKASKPMKPEKP